MTNYPHWDDLSPTDRAQSEPLRIPRYADVVTPPAERVIKRATPEKRRRVKNNSRRFVSRYIGVTRTQGHYVGQWRNERGTYSRGPRRPDTPDGELQAAWDWARATGKTALELR